jgi:hypothetical protein
MAGAQGHRHSMGNILWEKLGLTATSDRYYLCAPTIPLPLAHTITACCDVPLGEPCLPRRGGGVTSRVLRHCRLTTDCCCRGQAPQGLLSQDQAPQACDNGLLSQGQAPQACDNGLLSQGQAPQACDNWQLSQLWQVPVVAAL